AAGLLLVEEAGGAHLTRAGVPFRITGDTVLPFTTARDEATARRVVGLLSAGVCDAGPGSQAAPAVRPPRPPGHPGRPPRPPPRAAGGPARPPRPAARSPRPAAPPGRTGSRMPRPGFRPNCPSPTAGGAGAVPPMLIPLAVG